MALLGASAAQALPVHIEINGAVFSPEAEVDIQRHLRTLSTPPFTIRLQAPDIAAFAAFTQARIGEMMEVFVCDEVIFSPKLLAPISDGEIYIHTALVNGRLEAFVSGGCP